MSLFSHLDIKMPKKKIKRKGYPDGNLRVGYVWESTISGYAPMLEEQMKSVIGCHKVFHDKITYYQCVESPRIQLKEMFKFLKDGDTLVVHCISCLGASIPEVIYNVLTLLSSKCIIQMPHYHFDTTNYDTCNTMDAVFTGLVGILEQDETRESHKYWIRRQGS